MKFPTTRPPPVISWSNGSREGQIKKLLPLQLNLQRSIPVPLILNISSSTVIFDAVGPMFPTSSLTRMNSQPSWAS